MPLPTAARGLRRAELITNDLERAAAFHYYLLGWRMWESATGYDCWVGDRRCACLRQPAADERPGWRLVFAGGPQDGHLVGPDESAADMVGGRAQHGPWAPVPRSGEPCWAELCAEDAERSDDFWTSTLGWSVDGSVYTTEGRPLANRSDRPFDGGWGWFCHFAIGDVEYAANRVVELGGKVLEALPHPVLGDVVVITDPAGAVCGLARDTGRWGG